MQKILFSFLSIFLFQACSNDKACKDDCCKKAKSETSLPGNDILGPKKNTTLSCKLTTPELQQRKQTVIAQLKNLVQEKKELQNGYSFKFKGSDEMLMLLADFVKSERQCCDFFSFVINVKDQSTIWFDVTGPNGAKDFIQTELGL